MREEFFKRTEKVVEGDEKRRKEKNGNGQINHKDLKANNHSIPPYSPEIFTSFSLFSLL